jgi:hypothetical protein
MQQLLSKVRIMFSDKTFFKENNTNLYDLALWLAKNKSKCTNDELLEKINVHLAFTADDIQLWNNLIYQVVVQKDFYHQRNGHGDASCNGIYLITMEQKISLKCFLMHESFFLKT